MPQRERNHATRGYQPIRKIRIIIAGLRDAVLGDFPVAYKLVISVVVLVLTVVFQRWLDVTIVTLATGVMLSAELFNTAIERLCDFVEERNDERIRVIKDVAAAAAGMAILAWATVLLIEFGRLLPLLHAALTQP